MSDDELLRRCLALLEDIEEHPSSASFAPFTGRMSSDAPGTVRPATGAGDALRIRLGGQVITPITVAAAIARSSATYSAS